MDKKKLIAILMIGIAAFLWGMSYGFQAILSESLGPYTIIFLKGLSGVFLLLFCLFAKRKFDIKTIVSGMLIGVVNGVGLILQQRGIALTSVSNVIFISSLYILFIPIILLFAGRKPKKRIWLAILLACVGLYFLCKKDGTFVLGMGDLYIIISAIFFAFQIVLIGQYVQDSDAIVFCCMQQLTTSLIAGELMIFAESPHLSDFAGLLLPILFVMFGSGMFAQLLQNRFQRDIEPSLASLVMSLESVFGAFGGWLLLGQTLSGLELVGCALIFIAIILGE